MMIAILDLGIGNLFSIKRSFERIGREAKICAGISELRRSDALVLPGVGNFSWSLRKLESIRGAISELILDDHVPLLGICLGMQLLFSASEEGPGDGLNAIPGIVKRFPRNLRVPHMGWNNLIIVGWSPIMDGITERDYFYFAHSYYAAPEDERVVAAKTEYGVIFPSIISSGNIFGVQFHPEKSWKPGERIIRNFVKIIRR